MAERNKTETNEVKADITSQALYNYIKFRNKCGGYKKLLEKVRCYTEENGVPTNFNFRERDFDGYYKAHVDRNIGGITTKLIFEDKTKPWGMDENKKKLRIMQGYFFPRIFWDTFESRVEQLVKEGRFKEFVKDYEDMANYNV